jgi:hypothetical protein
MRPMSVTRRTLEALAKLKALSELDAASRLIEHALAEAVLHQIAATWLALVRQIGDSHGIRPTQVDSLATLLDVLERRGFTSVEALELSRLASEPGSWVETFWAHYAELTCPPEPMTASASNAIPLQDRSGLEAIRAARYRPWVEALAAQIESMQSRFHES